MLCVCHPSLSPVTPFLFSFSLWWGTRHHSCLWAEERGTPQLHEIQVRHGESRRRVSPVRWARLCSLVAMVRVRSPPTVRAPSLNSRVSCSSLYSILLPSEIGAWGRWNLVDWRRPCCRIRLLSVAATSSRLRVVGCFQYWSDILFF